MAKSSRTAVNSNDSSRRVNSLGLVPVVSKLRAASSCRSSTERIFLASFTDAIKTRVFSVTRVLLLCFRIEHSIDPEDSALCNMYILFYTFD